MSWKSEITGQLETIDSRPAVRSPATLGEIWNAEWENNGLDTAFGIHKPMQEAYSELTDRFKAITGRPVSDYLPEVAPDFDFRGMPGQIDALGQVIDRLPDNQQKLLADYKDVWGRAKQKAARTEREAEDVSGATYGLSSHAVGFLAGIARQSVDPVNIAMMPIGGPMKGPMIKWLGKEFLIGAGTQAVQEPYISARRDELGLQSDMMANIMQAGIGQAGFSGMLRLAGHAWHTWRGDGLKEKPDLAPADFEAAARVAERDAVFDRMAGNPAEGIDRLNEAARAMERGEPISGLSVARAASLELDGIQPIIRPDGSRLEARYAVVERRDLVTSHTLEGALNPAFPQELQPRDRAQGTSALQVNDIAGKLQPERLGPSPIAQEGAPIVGADGLVESGNGRVLAIEQAYARHPERAQAYRAYLEGLGFDLGAMKEPVLVRIRQQDLAPSERAAFAAESNVATTGALSASERAFVDAKGLHEGIMELWQGGQASDAKNAAFVRRFAGELLAPQEAKAFVDGDGRLAAQGQDRIEAAIVARAYGDKGIVRELTESTDQRSKALLGAFADAAPAVARLKAAVADGRISADLDIATPLVEAFNMVDRARRTGTKLGEALDQIDMIKGPVKPEVRAAVELFFRNDTLSLPASRDTVAERITSASRQALMHQAGGFFADEIDAAGILRAARFATENLSNMDLAKRMSEAAGLSEPKVRPELLAQKSDELGALFERAMADATRREIVDLGTIAPKDMLMSAGIDDKLSGFSHIVDSYGIRHALKNHGDAKIEAKRGQLPISDAEIRLIPNIISEPDSIKLSGTNNVGNPVIIYEKQIGDRLYYVEEARTKRSQWAMVTMYKREGEAVPAQRHHEKPGDPTPAAIAREPETNLPQRVEKVTPDPNEARIAAAVQGMETREFDFEQPDGSMKRMSAAQHLEELKAERKTALELNDCIDRTGGRIETKD